MAQTEITGHFIGGKPDASGSQKLERFDPATGEQMGYVVLADETTVKTAVESSKTAYQDWRVVEPAKRAVILRRFCELVTAQADELCLLVTREHGKTIMDAQGELQRGVENIEFATGIAEHLKGEYSKAVGPDIDSWSELSPLGVVVGITPFNFPVMVPMWMFPLAIACGNTFILKPSEKVPTAGYRLAELFSEAGLPDGVFNVVQGDQETAGWLLRHPDIKAASFVGSTPVARSIYRASGDSGKRVQALGGAKNHAVVLPDADVATATNAIMGAAYGSCGQRCMALSVVVSVGDETADAVADELSKKVSGLNIGPGVDNLDMGPLNSSPQRDRIVGLIQEGVDQGATILVDGRRHASYQQPGFYLGGTLFDNVKPGMSIYDEEIFGPVVTLHPFDSEDEAVAIANNTRYGLAGSVWTSDLDKGRRVSEAIDTGMVWVNTWLHRDLRVPFGGVKDSGVGREGGKWSLGFFSEAMNVCVKHD